MLTGPMVCGPYPRLMRLLFEMRDVVVVVVICGETMNRTRESMRRLGIDMIIYYE